MIIIKKWIDHFTIFAVMAMLVDGELLYVIVLKTIQLGTDTMRKNYTKLIRRSKMIEYIVVTQLIILLLHILSG